MKNITNLAAGGDARQVYVCSELSPRYRVYAYMTKTAPAGAETVSELSKLQGRVDVLILPLLTAVRHTEEGSFIPAGTEKLILDTLMPTLKPGALVLGGAADKETRELFTSRGFEFEDYFKRRELILRNCIPTAEGALKIAIEERSETVFGSRVLITGFGNVAKAAARLLSAAGAEVCCAVRRSDAAAEAECSGYSSIMLSELCEHIGSFDIIVNTVPARVIGREELECAGSGCLVIDLASLPGGVDFSAAKELGIRTVHALALPGKVAPAAAGRYIAETAEIILSERGVGNVT